MQSRRINSLICSRVLSLTQALIDFTASSGRATKFTSLKALSFGLGQMAQAEFACVVLGFFWNPNNGILGQAAWGKSACRAASATAKMITSCAARALPDLSKGGRPGGPQCTPSYALTGLAALHAHRVVLVRPDGLRGVAALICRIPGRFPPPPRLPRRPDRPAGRARDRSVVAQHRHLRLGDAGDGL